MNRPKLEARLLELVRMNSAGLADLWMKGAESPTPNVPAGLHDALLHSACKKSDIAGCRFWLLGSLMLFQRLVRLLPVHPDPPLRL